MITFEKALGKLQIPFSVEKTFTKNNFVVQITENHALEITCTNSDFPSRYQDYFVYHVWLENGKKYSIGSRNVFPSDVVCLEHIVKIYENWNTPCPKGWDKVTSEVN